MNLSHCCRNCHFAWSTLGWSQSPPARKPTLFCRGAIRLSPGESALHRPAWAPGALAARGQYRRRNCGTASQLRLRGNGKVGGTGIVGILRNGDGPTVMLRTSLTGFPSKRKPACLTPAKSYERRRRPRSSRDAGLRTRRPHGSLDRDCGNHGQDKESVAWNPDADGQPAGGTRNGGQGHDCRRSVHPLSQNLQRAWPCTPQTTFLPARWRHFGLCVLKLRIRSIITIFGRGGHGAKPDHDRSHRHRRQTGGELADHRVA